MHAARRAHHTRMRRNPAIGLDQRGSVSFPGRVYEYNVMHGAACLLVCKKGSFKINHLGCEVEPVPLYTVCTDSVAQQVMLLEAPDMQAVLELADTLLM